MFSVIRFGSCCCTVISVIRFFYQPLAPMIYSLYASEDPSGGIIKLYHLSVCVHLHVTNSMLAITQKLLKPNLIDIILIER